MTDSNGADEREIHEAVQTIITALLPFGQENRLRIIRTAQTFFGFGESAPTGYSSDRPHEQTGTAARRALSFGDRSELPPKEFLFQKQPITDVERVACLAYYLSHFRDVPHFKTVDISKLNTEAAQVKFSNTAYAIANAIRAKLLAPASRGTTQLTAIGERFVDALPDRIAAKEILSNVRTRRKKLRNSNEKNAPA